MCQDKISPELLNSIIKYYSLFVYYYKQNDCRNQTKKKNYIIQTFKKISIILESQRTSLLNDSIKISVYK